MDVTLLVSAIFGLMVITNVVTQVLKSLTYDKIPTNLLACLVAFIVTAAAGFIYVSINSVTIVPWMIVAAIGLAFFVAFAAMFGFDKLRELIDQWVNIKKNK